MRGYANIIYIQHYDRFLLRDFKFRSLLQFRSEEDKKNFCFICNLASHEFERRGQGFDHHVKNNHNMWNYIYLSIYLDQIDVSDHNAIQKFIYDMVSDVPFYTGESV